MLVTDQYVGWFVNAYTMNVFVIATADVIKQEDHEFLAPSAKRQWSFSKADWSVVVVVVSLQLFT